MALSRRDFPGTGHYLPRKYFMTQFSIFYCAVDTSPSSFSRQARHHAFAARVNRQLQDPNSAETREE
jgi:hypothetical protein